MHTVEAATLGEGWLSVSRRIVERGEHASYDRLATMELALVTLVVERPDPDDGTIEALGDADRLAWMRSSFADRQAVPELGGAASYAPEWAYVESLNGTREPSSRVRA